MTTLTRLAATVAAVALTALAAALAPALAGARPADKPRSFHGTVLSTPGDAIRLARADGTTMRFAVTSSTRFERLGGLAALKRGMAIEVKGVRSADGWVARKVERDDDPNHDAGDDHGGDRGGQSSDDPPGDDHGGDRGGHGSDDPPGDDHGGDDHGGDDR